MEKYWKNHNDHNFRLHVALEHKVTLLSHYQTLKLFSSLTLNLPTTTIVAQPFNVIKWQLKFNPVA